MDGARRSTTPSPPICRPTASSAPVWTRSSIRRTTSSSRTGNSSSTENVPHDRGGFLRPPFADGPHDGAADNDRVAAAAQRFVVLVLRNAEADGERLGDAGADLVEARQQRGIELAASAGDAGRRDVVDEVVAG